MDKSSRDFREMIKNTGSDNNVGNISTCFFSLPPKQFTLLSSLIGIILIENLSLEQQNSLGNFIVNLGQAVLTAAAQGQLLQSNNQEKDNIRQQIQILKKQILEMEKELI